MKRIGTFALTLALAGTLTLPALAEEPELLIAPSPTAYSTAIFVNGQELDVSKTPVAKGVPMRLVAEADHGSANWYEEEGTGAFYLDGNVITVTFATGAVDVNGTVLEGVSAEVVDGVTFLPADVLGGLEGYGVNLNPELDVNRIDITTPNGAPLVKLAYEIIEASDMSRGMKASADELENYGITAANFTEVVGFFPMMTSPDTVVIGKVAEGKLDAVKAELETYRKAQEDTFSWYLAQNLPKVQDARVEVAGDYILFLIAGDADKGVELFQTGVKDLQA